jgi:hypothetical protein
MSTSFAPVPFNAPRAERAPNLKAPASAAGSRAASSVLLAAVVSALVVVANQVVDTWTEGHLLAAWIVLWVVAFAALALLAAPARRAITSLRTSYVAWNERRVQEAQDQQYWQAALNDARLMADISRAMSAAAIQDIKAYY